jgi:SpoVK/Ycf46/Vps4 family AAA+-type ATPase
VLAATNHEHLLDAAIWRRFAFRLRLGLPGTEIRAQMFDHFLVGHRPPGLGVDQLAAAAEGLSGADIRGLCEDARREAILSNAEHVSESRLLLRVARARVPELDAMPMRERMLAMRELSLKLFTVRRLAELFDVSTGKVSMLLREGET